MVLSRLASIARSPRILKANKIHVNEVRTATSTRSGGILNEPHQTSLGILKLVLTVVPGLLIGAAISKHIANFLEENDLFVPSDDDDEDD